MPRYNAVCGHYNIGDMTEWGSDYRDRLKNIHTFIAEMPVNGMLPGLYESMGDYGVWKRLQSEVWWARQFFPKPQKVFPCYFGATCSWTVEEMPDWVNFIDADCILIDAGTVSGKSHDEAKQWLLDVAAAAQSFGNDFGFYWGDALNEDDMGWTVQDVADFQAAGLWILIDCYASENGNLNSANKVTWNYQNLIINMWPGPEYWYYKTYSEYLHVFNLIKQQPSLRGIILGEWPFRKVPGGVAGMGAVLWEVARYMTRERG